MGIESDLEGKCELEYSSDSKKVVPVRKRRSVLKGFLAGSAVVALSAILPIYTACTTESNGHSSPLHDWYRKEHRICTETVCTYEETDFSKWLRDVADPFLFGTGMDYGPIKQGALGGLVVGGLVFGASRFRMWDKMVGKDLERSC